MGVKQGCPLSPTLFGLYLDDLEDAMRAKQHLLDAPSLDGLRLLALLYADDLALGSTSLAGLQAQLDVLHDYARRWGLTVNVEKTKAVIFKAASTPAPPTWRCWRRSAAIRCRRLRPRCCCGTGTGWSAWMPTGW